MFVAANGRLPRAQPSEVPGEGMQPPLVYLAAAPLVARTGLDAARAADALHEVGLYVYGLGAATAGGPAIAFAPHGARFFTGDDSLGALGALRATSLAFGVIAVALMFGAARRIGGGDLRYAALASALLAFDPQFLFVSGYFTNDTAAAAVGAAALWLVGDAFASGGAVRRHYLAGGALAALGLLVKTSTVPALLVAAATVVALDPRAPRARATDAARGAALALALAGPYLVWAGVHRGGWLGVSAVYASASQLHVPAGERLAYLAWPYWRWTFESYWLRFGWMNLRAPTPVYLGLFALCAAGIGGSFACGARGLHRYLLASVAATGAAHFALNLTVVSAQGRHWFAAAPQLAALLALGLDRLAGSARRRNVTVAAVVIALAALDLYGLVRVLAPAYQELP